MQNSTQIAPTNVFLEKDWLTRILPLELIGDYVKKTDLPAKNSGTVEYGRMENIAPVSGSALPSIKSYVEGVTPNDTSVTYTKIQVPTSLYMNLIRFTEQVALLNERGILDEAMKVNSENQVNLNELILATALASGTNVHRYTDSIGGVSGAARANVVGMMNPDGLNKAVRFMESGSSTTGPVPKFTEGVKASSGYGTTPIPGAWLGWCHPDVMTDLRNMPGFTRAEFYADNLKGEGGIFNGIRWIAHTMCKVYPDAGAAVAGTKSTTGTLSDVYACTIMGPDAIASVTLKSAGDLIYISHKNPTQADPGGLQDIIGYKLRTGTGVIDQNRLIRLEVAVSAG